MRRKKNEEEKSGYNWQDTYGDMVTLLLCFFVLLYSFSSFDLEKWHELVRAFTGSMNGGGNSVLDESMGDSLVDIGAIGPNNQNGQNGEDGEGGGEGAATQEEIDIDFDQLYNNIVSYVRDNNLEDQVNVSRTEHTILIRFDEMALFNSGQAMIRLESRATLASMTEIISENLSSVKMICIEGHTDDVPISTSEFTDNWDLSTKRATNTLRLILDTALIDSAKLSATGYGEYQPIAANDTEEGRAKNRRVDMVLQKLELE